MRKRERRGGREGVLIVPKLYKHPLSTKALRMCACHGPGRGRRAIQESLELTQTVCLQLLVKEGQCCVGEYSVPRPI